MRILALAVTVSAVISVGCRDQQPVQPRASGGPEYMISDGAHNGNAHFFFLPPLAPDPSALFHASTFNTKLAPVVEACILTGDPSSGSPVDCMTSGGTPMLVFGPVPMALDLTNEQYTRNWDTKSPTPLDPSKFYRILVRGAPLGTALGFLDVDPVDQGMKNVRTGEVVQFQDGRTLPIKVRIEDGAFGSSNPDHVEQVVPSHITTPTGTLDITTITGFAGARFSDGWLPAGIDQVVVIIERIAVTNLSPGTSCLQSGLTELEGCYRFRTDPDLHGLGPDGTDLTFRVNVIAGVCFEMPIHTQAPFQLFRREEDSEGTPAGTTVALEDAEAPFLTCDKFAPTRPPSPLGTLKSGRLLEFASAGWQVLAHGIGRLVTPQALHAVDLGAGGSTDGFSRFGYARGATMVKVAATDNQVASPGTSVPLDPTVCLTTLHPSPRPLVSAPVMFAVTGGGGTVGGGTNVTVSSGTDGCAHATWFLGASTTTGGNTLSVTALATGSPLTFTATATSGVTGVTVDAGGFHSCALKVGQAFCWGNNRGQLGDGTSADRLVPTAVAGGLTFAALSAGDGASCGLTPTGAAYCWGFNSSGQLGDGTTIDRLVPTAVAGGLTFAALSPGNNQAGGHTCGVTTSGAAYCWGRNANGQLGDGTTTDRLVPTPVAGGVTFAAVITGGQHTCGVATNGAAYCWGFNGGGGLGDGTTTQRLVPTLVAGGVTFAALSAGIAHTCGVTPTSALYCWGFNGNGQLGDNTLIQRLVPTPVGGALTFTGVSTGFAHTCGVTTTGAAQCWGFNGQGQLGDGTTTERHIPTLVQGGLSFAAVSAGSSHACGVTTSGVAYCWGLNGTGQVGDGTTTNRLVPTAVAFP